MSLRSRLTTAFLVVVLGPVLVGAVFVAAVMSHLADSRGDALANSAVTMVDSTLGTICERIQASAAAVALNYRSGDRETRSRWRSSSSTAPWSTASSSPASPRSAQDAGTDIGAEAPDGSWVDCGETVAYAGSGPIVALGAQAEVQNADGSTAGLQRLPRGRPRVPRPPRPRRGRRHHPPGRPRHPPRGRQRRRRALGLHGLLPALEHRHRRHRRDPDVLDARRDGHRLGVLRGRPRRLARPLDHAAARGALGRRRARRRRGPQRARARPRARRGRAARATRSTA